MNSSATNPIPSIVRDPTTTSFVGRWFVGLVVGTVLVAVTSPWFVRTYSPRTWDSLRQRYVYPENLSYRWRSEGYATSHVGPHGIIGRADMPSAHVPQIALWGDSQAEGVTVPDDHKLWATLQATHPEKQFIPFAQSGEDASDWIRGIELVEKEMRIAEHWILVCELQDLAVLNSGESPIVKLSARQSAWLDYIPDFVVEAGRGLLFDSENQMRRFRFSVGPSAESFQKPAGELIPGTREDAFWASVAKRLSESTSLPITVIYAPKLPIIWSDAIIEEDLDDDDFRRLLPHLRRQSISVVDCRDAFRQSAASGEFPHGFHNGRFGWGHLNRVGNRLIAATTIPDTTIPDTTIPDTTIVEESVR